jgi:hypothetical protein
MKQTWNVHTSLLMVEMSLLERHCAAIFAVTRARLMADLVMMLLSERQASPPKV